MPSSEFMAKELINTGEERAEYEHYLDQTFGKGFSEKLHKALNSEVAGEKPGGYLRERAAENAIISGDPGIKDWYSLQEVIGKAKEMMPTWCGYKKWDAATEYAKDIFVLSGKKDWEAKYNRPMKDFLYSECEKALERGRLTDAANLAAKHRLLFDKGIFPDRTQDMIKASEKAVSQQGNLAPIINRHIANIKILQAKEISFKPQVTIPGGVKIII